MAHHGLKRLAWRSKDVANCAVWLSKFKTQGALLPRHSIWGGRGLSLKSTRASKAERYASLLHKKGRKCTEGQKLDAMKKGIFELEKEEERE
jgi:hypothetical protein